MSTAPIHVSEELTARFMRSVEKTEGCWLWALALDRKGYGRFNSLRADGRRWTMFAHRYSYSAHVGPIPPGLFVCHRCDNPRCVNPAHLFVGTNTDNVRDMDAKGRRVNNQPKGSAHGNAILDERRVAEIFSLLNSKSMTQRAIARRFGVCFATVGHIKSGHQWSHVTGAKR